MSAAAVPAYTIEFHPAAFRIKYVEARRHVLVPITFTAGDTWEVLRDRIGWWEDRDGRRTPLTAEEQTQVVDRVLAAAQDRHLRVHLPGVPPPAPTDETGAPVTNSDEDLSPPDGEDALLVDPEVAPFIEFESSPVPVAAQVQAGGNPSGLLAQIASALVQMQPMADAGWEQALSIARQLQWCQGALRGEIVEPPPGPFSMGLIATREFDMYGNQPALASLISAIEQAMNARMRG